MDDVNGFVPVCTETFESCRDCSPEHGNSDNVGSSPTLPEWRVDLCDFAEQPECATAASSCADSCKRCVAHKTMRRPITPLAFSRTKRPSFAHRAPLIPPPFATHLTKFAHVCEPQSDAIRLRLTSFRRKGERERRKVSVTTRNGRCVSTTRTGIRRQARSAACLTRGERACSPRGDLRRVRVSDRRCALEVPELPRL